MPNQLRTPSEKPESGPWAIGSATPAVTAVSCSVSTHSSLGEKLPAQPKTRRAPLDREPLDPASGSALEKLATKQPQITRDERQPRPLVKDGHCSDGGPTPSAANATGSLVSGSVATTSERSQSNRDSAASSRQTSQPGFPSAPAISVARMSISVTDASREAKRHSIQSAGVAVPPVRAVVSSLTSSAIHPADKGQAVVTSISQ